MLRCISHFPAIKKINILTRFFLILIPIMALLNAGCSSSVDDDGGVSRELSIAEKKLVESSNAFGLKLFREIVLNEEPSDVFISPLSVSMALGMTYNGADGETFTAMHNTLEYGDMTNEEVNESYKSLIELILNLDPEVTTELANSIWYNERDDFEQSFMDVCRQYFDAEVAGMDFHAPDAADIINGWISDKTHDKINDVVNPGDISDAAMLLINAIYFLGSWTYEFDKDKTIKQPFYTSDSTQIEVDMMNQREYFPYHAAEDYQAVDLPYGGGDFSMTIVLPNQNVSLDSVIAGLTDESWNELTEALAPDSGNVHFPKFKIEYKLSMVDVLSAMGMEIAFTDMADFRRMRRGGGLFISDVIHQSYVKVDEEGTEAAAVTVVIGSYVTSGPTPSGFDINVNRPFLFAIRENHSGTILFMGKVLHPEWEE